MRSNTYLAAGVVLALSLGLAGRVAADGATQGDSDVIARIHFAGSERIIADPNGAELQEIGAMPESVALREEVIKKLATAPFRMMEKNSSPRTNDNASLIRPLVEDIWKSETYLEMRGPTNDWPELVLAVKLNNERADLWRTSLATVLKDWTGIAVKDVQAEGFSGWELKKHHAPNVFRFIRAGDWVVFGWGEDELRLQAAILKKFKDEKRPVAAETKYWLNARLDWPAYAAKHALPLPFPLPAMELKIEGRADYLRPELKLQFAAPLHLNLEPWLIPTNRIFDPISSITFVRGFGPHLDQLPDLANLKATPLPNQIIAWGIKGVPFETSALLPVKDGTNYLARVAPALVSLINSNMAARGRSSHAEWTTNHEIVMVGLPFLAPFLRAADDDYLMAGLFVPPPPGKALPWTSILAPISPTNVVYYNWEITGERLSQWIPMTQLYFIGMAGMLPKVDLPGQKWLAAIKPKLKTSATVGTLTGPNELTLVRNSQVGFTAFELNALALWIDGPGFPIEGGVEPTFSPGLRNMVPPHK